MLRHAYVLTSLGLAAMCTVALAAPRPALANDEAAHALAQRFSGGDGGEPSTASATAPQAAAQAPEADAAKDEARRLAADARRAAQEARAAADRLRAEEQEMLSAARAEAAERQNEAVAAPAHAPAAQPGKIKITATEATPEPEHRRALPPPMSLGAAPLIEEPAPGGLLSLGQHASPRVTILIAMEPGDRGIRRFSKSADPVLCLGARCFISKGPAAAADELTKSQALGPANTFGRRAGDCRKSLTCAFRGIALEGGAATIQPVDLKVMIHDRRQPQTVEPDTSCRLSAGTLSCDKTVSAKGWRAWIVPEAIAEKAGSAVLASALKAGLGEAQAAGLSTASTR